MIDDNLVVDTIKINDFIYQYRFFNGNVNTVDAGTWTEWENINSNKYADIVQLIDRGYMYQTRVMTTVASHPSVEVLAQYKLGTTRRELNVNPPV